MLKPPKGSNQLRIGRTSVPHAEYLVTFCTHERRPGLASSGMFAALRAELERLATDSVLQARAFTVMPDHVHLLVALGEMLTLPRALARLKSKLSPALKSLGLSWQSGFHDHRLRAEEEIAPYFRYIHLNPYQARLIEAGEVWPYTWFRQEDWAWFQTMTDDGKALPEWLANLP